MNNTKSWGGQRKILSMTEAPGKRFVKGEQVTYGTFEDVPPLADGGGLRLHYVSVSRGPSPFELHHNSTAVPR